MPKPVDLALRPEASLMLSKFEPYNFHVQYLTATNMWRIITGNTNNT